MNHVLEKPTPTSFMQLINILYPKFQVIQELHEAGFRLVDDKPLMRTNYFLEFIKSGKQKGVE
jgi:hypothetical protein